MALTIALKLAETDLSEVTNSTQTDVVLVEHPVQPVNVEPVFAAAVSVTCVAVLYVTVPVKPFQVIVPVDAVTVPEPVPVILIVRVAASTKDRPKNSTQLKTNTGKRYPFLDNIIYPLFYQTFEL
ncbi:hypothetical protein MBAV_006093 [Candidatus Magnetobacterium bavaricum]|uniref:Uncharacterized protein n=1 Tax=Candidatus Magnetobacterium bavaricum TaxID=29290 RepID=A0A0F3GIJ4_9BACT|nr:hypothetical protein MBAV_006093 [Candidatus Magnetobacterium bavaricum]